MQTANNTLQQLCIIVVAKWREITMNRGHHESPSGILYAVGEPAILERDTLSRQPGSVE